MFLTVQQLPTDTMALRETLDRSVYISVEDSNKILINPIIGFAA